MATLDELLQQDVLCDPVVLLQAQTLLQKLRVAKGNERIRKAIADNNIQEMEDCLEMIRKWDCGHEVDARLARKAGLLVERSKVVEEEEVKVNG